MKLSNYYIMSLAGEGGPRSGGCGLYIVKTYIFIVSLIYYSYAVLLRPTGTSSKGGQ